MTHDYEAYEPSAGGEADETPMSGATAACGSCPACGTCQACLAGRTCTSCACAATGALPTYDTYPHTAASRPSTSWRPRRATSGSSSSTRRPGRARSGVAAGCCALGAGGAGVAAANNDDGDGSRQDRYDQCVSEFLAEHPREDADFGLGSDYGSDFGSAYGSPDDFGSDYDFGSYSGTFLTPEDSCGYLR